MITSGLQCWEQNAMSNDPKDRSASQHSDPEKVKVKTLSGDRIQLEFLIEDLAKQLIIDRGPLVANGCNGCNSCS
jgi:hypothetical protein